MCFSSLRSHADVIVPGIGGGVEDVLIDGAVADAVVPRNVVVTVGVVVYIRHPISSAALIHRTGDQSQTREQSSLYPILNMIEFHHISPYLIILFLDVTFTSDGGYSLCSGLPFMVLQKFFLSSREPVIGRSIYPRM